MKILKSLIENAIKFSESEAKLTVRATAQNQTVQIDVIDSGIGISEIDQLQIFDRFFQAEQKANVLNYGTGLGLSVAKALVTMLGGEIWVQSKLDHGSTFSFTLPRA